MKKISVCFLLVLLLGLLLNLNINLTSIHPANGCYMKQTQHVEYINVSGEFQNQDEINIVLSYPVIVDQVYVNENQFVNKGQALFSIDTERMQSAMEGNLDSDIINQLSFHNINNLSDYGSGMNVDSMNNSIIYAPDSGIVSKINIFPSAVVLQNSNLLSIDSTETVLAKFTISQTDFGKIKVGDTVEISPVAFPDSKYKGTILDKNAVVKKQSTVTGSKVVLDVFASIYDSDKRVSDGLQINGKIHNENSEIINTIDHNYIYQDEVGEYVYVLKHGIANKVYITTGIETQDYTEIITDFPYETIFLKGKINDGDRVVLAELSDESV